MYKNIWIYFEVEGSRLKIPDAKLVSASASLNKQRKNKNSYRVMYASKKKRYSNEKMF